MTATTAHLNQPLDGWTYRGTIAGPESGHFQGATEQTAEFYVNGWTVGHLRSPITVSFTPDAGASLGGTEGRPGRSIDAPSPRAGSVVYHDGWWAIDPEQASSLHWDTTLVHSLTQTGRWGTLAIRAPKSVATSDLLELLGRVSVDGGHS